MDSSAQINIPEGKHIVFFDGVCNLCNTSVNYIIDRDDQGYFIFESLQSENAKAILGKDYPHHLSHMVLRTKEGLILQKSNAVLFILSGLGGIYRGYKVLYIFPRFFRDWVYGIIAQNRYKWFGKQSACRLPEPNLKKRFLEAYQ